MFFAVVKYMLLEHSVFDQKVTRPLSQKVHSVFIPPSKKEAALLIEHIHSRKPDGLQPVN